MQIVIDIDEARFKDIQRIAEVQLESNHFKTAEQIIAKGMPIEQEQKTEGYWIFKNHNWHCSKCGETPKMMGYVGNADFMKEHFKFCNHCGAKMKSEE